jgi:hypothetical protein
LTLLGVALPLVSVLIWIQGGPSRITLVLGLYTLAFPALRLLMDRLGFRASALFFLLLLGLTCFFIGTRGGAAVGNVGLSLVLVLLSALFFGKRGALVGSAGILLAFTLAGVMLMSGRLPPVDTAACPGGGRKLGSGGGKRTGLGTIGLARRGPTGCCCSRGKRRLQSQGQYHVRRSGRTQVRRPRGSRETPHLFRVFEPGKVNEITYVP